MLISRFPNNCTAPAHASSWPFKFDFDLMDKARWLNEIFEQEEITKPVIVGQSMGGYVGQAYTEMYPEKLKGFVSIDSAPLQRKIWSWIQNACRSNGKGFTI